MNIELGLKVIQEVAVENEYKLSNGEFSFEIIKNTLRPKSFKVKKKDEDILIYQLEHDTEEYSTNAIYTLRDMRDVIKYCNLLSMGNEIRSGRNR
jgi:hypothetical protein